MQIIPMTAPVCLQTKNKSVTMPILVSNQTSVHLLGRDALCKLWLQIWCSPEEVYIDNRNRYSDDGCRAKSKCYWIEQKEPDVRQTINKWGKFIEAQIPEA